MLYAFPISTNGNFADTLSSAVSWVADQSDLEDVGLAVSRAVRIVKLLGARPIGDDWESLGFELRDEIIWLIAGRLYPGDDRAQSSLVSGYLSFRSTTGEDVPPLLVHDAIIWQRGRAANPSYSRHVAARDAASAAFRERFNTSAPTTAKGVHFWRRQYMKAFACGSAA